MSDGELEDPVSPNGWVFECQQCGVKQSFDLLRLSHARTHARVAGWYVGTRCIGDELDLCPGCNEKRLAMNLGGGSC